jgi:hypothetical protein
MTQKYVMTFEQFIQEASKTPKLGRENQNAADSLVAWLKTNPGAIQSDVHRFINKQKGVLKNFKGPMHYKNYENILNYLSDNKLIRIEKDRKHVKYYAIGVNEKTMYTQDNLEVNDFELGKILKSEKEIKKGKEYCIVDLGMGQWMGGLKYEGKKGDSHLFVSTIQFDDLELEYTDDELFTAIKDGEFAFCD